MFIEYQIDEETTILIKSADTQESGMVKAASGGEEQTEKAATKFEAALEPVHRVALAMRHKLRDLEADETEVIFGLTTTGKLGNFAIAEVGVEANFTVKLKWTKEKKKV
jgi:hypothetical protein